MVVRERGSVRDIHDNLTPDGLQFGNRIEGHAGLAAAPGPCPKSQREQVQVQMFHDRLSSDIRRNYPAKPAMYLRQIH